jgi:mannitol/fructose-specific phosphotransferase system IIA component (Ntr-type)
MALEITANPVAPATLAHYTRASLVVPQLRQCDTAGVISELSQLLQRESWVPDLLPFYHAALNQELLSNSALECGLAIPHARLSGVKQLQFALGRAPQPIIWGAKGSWRVQVIFLLAVPATDAAAYLHLLASISRLGQQPQLLAQLRQAETAEDILSLLDKIKLRQG